MTGSNTYTAMGKGGGVLRAAQVAAVVASAELCSINIPIDELETSESHSPVSHIDKYISQATFLIYMVAGCMLHSALLEFGMI